MTTRVVHVNDQVDGAVYIGRANGRKRLKASLFANPFYVQRWGRSVAISKYREFLLSVLSGEAGSKWGIELATLRGRPLACWCRHDGQPKTDANACHGDVLVELLDRYTDDELRAMGGAS